MRASFLTRHQNMWGLLLAKKKDHLAMNEAVKNLKLIIMECEFPRMVAWRRRMLMLKTSSFWELFLQTDSISIVAPKRKKEKRTCFIVIVCLKKMARFDLKVRNFMKIFFFLLPVYSWMGFIFLSCFCVRACRLGCCLIEKCGFIKAFWHFDLVEKQTLLIPVLLRRSSC